MLSHSLLQSDLLIAKQRSAPCDEAHRKRPSRNRLGLPAVDIAETACWLPALSTRAPHGAESDQARTQKQHAGRLRHGAAAAAARGAPIADIYTAGLPSRATNDIGGKELPVRILLEVCQVQSACRYVKLEAAAIRLAAAAANSLQSEVKVARPVHMQRTRILLRVNSTRNGKLGRRRNTAVCDLADACQVKSKAGIKARVNELVAVCQRYIKFKRATPQIGDDDGTTIRLAGQTAARAMVGGELERQRRCWRRFGRTNRQETDGSHSDRDRSEPRSCEHIDNPLEKLTFFVIAGESNKRARGKSFASKRLRQIPEALTSAKCKLFRQSVLRKRDSNGWIALIPM
jgi:hypothetical protein